METCEYAYGLNPLDYIGGARRKLLSFGLPFDMANPKTIQEKLVWLNFFEPNPLKVKCADKLQVRDYCKERIGEDLCVPVLKIYNSGDELDFSELPDKFILKCNHGSGMNIIVTNKTESIKNMCKHKLNSWLATDFAFVNNYELHYHPIPRRAFAEQCLINKENESLIDYKFWCFNGKPKIWTMNTGHGHGDIMYYDMDFNQLNLYGLRNIPNFSKPDLFDKMVEYSKKLAEPFYFVRVDFYQVNGRIYLGEMTFMPGACMFTYKDKKDNFKIGDLLDLSECLEKQKRTAT